MLEQQENAPMGREQHKRGLDPEICEILDNWRVCPVTEDAQGLFDSLKISTDTYLSANGQLYMKAIIRIVKDLREMLNPNAYQPMYYFTDIICDAILRRFKNINENQFDTFTAFVDECNEYVYLQT